MDESASRVLLRPEPCHSRPFAFFYTMPSHVKISPPELTLMADIDNGQQELAKNPFEPSEHPKEWLARDQAALCEVPTCLK